LTVFAKGRFWIPKAKYQIINVIGGFVISHSRFNIFVWVFFIPFLSFGQTVPPKMTILFSMAYTHFDPEVKFDAAAGVHVGVGYALSPHVQLHLRLTSTHTQQTFDNVVAGEGTITVSATTATANLQWQAISLSGNNDIYLSGGGGFIRYARDAYHLSLGTLGPYTIEAKNEWHPVMEVGVLFRQHIINRFSLQLSPGIETAFASPVQWHTYFRGGLAIAIW